MQCPEGRQTLFRVGVRVVTHSTLSATWLSKAAKVDIQLQCDMSSTVAVELCCTGVLQDVELDARPRDPTGSSLRESCSANCHVCVKFLL